MKRQGKKLRVPRDAPEMAGMTAVVTGAAMGIGAAVAELLARRGARVAIIDRAESEAEAVAARIGNESIAIAGDVSRGDDVDRAIYQAVDAFGHLDILCNVAGIQRYGSVETTVPEAWDEVINVNLRGVYLVSRCAMSHLRARRGSIVNMASVQSFATQRAVAAYTTAKHALIGLTRSMALDVAASGVRVNAVAPGSVDTPMLRWAVEQDRNPAALMKSISQMHPLGRIAQASEVAEAVCFLASRRASFITGATLVVDGGLLLPLGGAPSEEEGMLA